MILKDNKYSPSIFHKIIFTISLFIIFFIGAITYKHINNVSKTSKLVLHTYEVNLELEHLFSYIKDSENNMRGFLISKDTLYLKPYRVATKNINTSFILLKELTKNNPTQQKNLEDLYKIVNKRNNYITNYSTQNIDIDIATNDIFKKSFKESSRLLVDIRTVINKMVDIENKYLKKSTIEYDKQKFLTPILTLSILFITLLLIVFAYYQITRDVEKLQTANNSLNKSQFLSYQAEILSNFGTWEWNLNTNELEYSDNLYRILGYEPQSFYPTNDKFLSIVHPEDIKKVEVIMHHIIQNEELPHSYFRIIQPNGNIRHFRASGKLFIDELDNKNVLGITEDVTEELNKNELLKSTNIDLIKINNELKIFDESSKQAEILGNYGSWVLNYDTLKFTYSDNKYRLLGHEPQTFNPSIKNLLNFVHPDDKTIVLEANKKALELGEIPTMNYRIIRKNGDIRHFKTIAKLFTDLKGKKTMIGTTQDVTEDFNKSLQLNERNKELEQNIKELNEFNHVASHDLQEPLRKIQTFISRLNDKEKENLTDFGKEYLARIEKASNRMRILINDLLQYSRTSRTEKTLDKIDLNEMLLNSKLELSQNIKEKKAQIIHQNLPVINAVSFQMQQLFTNLISNSLKYSKQEVAPVISISSSEIIAKNEPVIKDKSTNKYHKISITDNGIGFEQENAEKIFLLFNRLHGKTEYHGTGVGLAICKKIVENHNGFIFAESKVNIGSTFTFYIPV